METAPPAPHLARSIPSQNVDSTVNRIPQNPSNDPAVVRCLGIYAVAVALLLAVGLLSTWNLLYRPASPTVIVVNPPLVTLDPTKDDRYTFTATVLPKSAGDSATAITWSVEGDGQIDAHGIFRPNPATTLNAQGATSKGVKVTAALTSNPARSGMAIVHLLPGKHLEILPQGISAFPSQQIPFRAPNAEATWSTDSSAGSVTSDGLFTARSASEHPSVVQVTAIGKTPGEIAASAVVVTPPFAADYSQSYLGILFVILCGSLGSMIYFAASFVNFVGNRTFRSSWFWFYISRPFVGGALALVFYFVVGSGIVPGAAVNDLMKVGMVSSLVGLFSDKAMQKLSDVLDVLLATRDDRKDKLREHEPNQPENSPKPADRSAAESPSKSLSKSA